MRVVTEQDYKWPFKHYKARLFIFVTALLLVSALFVDSSWRTGAEFHTLMELTATLLALIIGINSLIHYFTNKDDVFLFIGVGFFGTGLLDGYHAIVTSISFIDLYPSTPSELIAWSWNASRTFLSILMFLSYWVWARPQSESIRTLVNDKRLVGFLSLLLLSIFLFFIYAPLPSAYYPDDFLGRPGDLIPAVIFLLALSGFYRKADWKEDSFEYWLVLSLLINVICQFFYMPFSRQIFDGMFDAAHLLKIISYVCVMIGLLVSLYELHRRYEKINLKLEDEIQQRQQAEQALNKNINLLKRQRIAAVNVAEDAERAYTNLKSIEANIRSIVEFAPYAIISVDQQSIIREWNKQAEIIFGWSQAEAIGKTLIETIIPKQHHKAHGDGMAHYLETGVAKIINQDLELTALNKEGKEFPIQLVLTEIDETKGSSFIAFARDISKEKEEEANRKSTEQTLIESEQRFRGAFDSAAHGIALVALDGHWLKVNKSLCDILGYSEAELLKIDFQTVTHPADLDIDLEKVQQLINGEIDAYHLEKRYIHKEGHAIWALLSVSLVRDKNNEPQYFISQIQDLTAEKAVEAEREVQKQLLIDKQAAEAANVAKSSFLANMSHELRTPLNAIIGYSEMLAEEASDSGQQQALDDLKKIQSSGRHLLALINDILDLSKIEAGKMELSTEHFSVQELLYEVTATMQPLIEKNKNIFKTEYPNDTPQMNSDPQKIKQALFNLLSNAAKFTSDGEITLTVRSDQDNEGQTTMEFIVSDTGIGMNEEQLSRVFSAFTQADINTTRTYGGTGLGLAITERFCQMLGGEIDVSSEPGKGSVFTVILPLELPETCLPKKTGPEVADFSDSMEWEEFSRLKQEALQTDLEDKSIAELDAGTRDNLILVIDDDLGARELLSFHLSRLHFHVVTAENGMQGIKLARELQPKAIVLDLLMPHMDGWAVLQILKADPLLADIPVIMCSMDAEQKETGFAMGATDYLIKPINRDRLVKTLGQYCLSSSCNLLVVEDDEATRELVVRTAKTQGWQVVSAKNGVDGLTKIESQVPDLILLDLMMPEMDGFQFVETLQQHSEWCDIPVIVMTAKDLTADDRSRLNGYVQIVLEKGQYTKDNLMEQITRQIESTTSSNLN